MLLDLPMTSNKWAERNEIVNSLLKMDFFLFYFDLFLFC